MLNERTYRELHKMILIDEESLINFNFITFFSYNFIY